ncbi:hypothetical protein [Flocculibacter collagenilyticus]|uniref:hypothetical protein n=1 Tax=Flocculibacter collagenilyticus TaxID=2744479 RepID=UPI0018F56E54|nr:hypothetical protein [Flocculibacter collagenilyticus]
MVYFVLFIISAATLFLMECTTKNPLLRLLIMITSPVVLILIFDYFYMQYKGAEAIGALNFIGIIIGIIICIFTTLFLKAILMAYKEK